MTDPIASNLATLARIMHQAAEIVDFIQEEYRDNGNDSLANIDYGAELNKLLTDANVMFARVDAAGLFTMGWEPEIEPSSWVFSNNAGQRFSISGVRAEEAFNDGLSVIQAGKPFGRKGMKRLTDTYGVVVSFVHTDAVDAEDDGY